MFIGRITVNCFCFSLYSDTASLNSLGYCRIEGRIKDMIIRGGENIYPAEIEEFIYKHPKVREVQVSTTTSGGQQRTINGLMATRHSVYFKNKFLINTSSVRTLHKNIVEMTHYSAVAVALSDLLSRWLE